MVVVLVDQLRKDSFDAWSPLLNDLARRGVAFEQMRAAAPWTYPSVISMMSGLYPHQHGADGHSGRPLLYRFDADVPLIHRTLRSAGYRTAAFVSNPFLREWNSFHEGFDDFNGDFVRNLGAVRMNAANFATPEMFSPSVNREVRKHFDAHDVDRPEFTYIHYIDVHGPWTGAPFEPTYEASIRFVDRKIWELYVYFTERYPGKLLFFVTSDHGMSLGDDVRVGHGPRWRIEKLSVHDFNLRIPFVVLPSSLVPERGAVDVPCSNVDFVPTVLELVGVEAPMPLPGRSLAYVFSGGAPPEDERRAIYSRTSAFGGASDAVVYEGRKYLRHFDENMAKAREHRIFDLANDPRETRSVGSDFAPVEALLGEVAELPAFPAETEPGPLEPDLERQLRALGYLDGGDER